MPNPRGKEGLALEPNLHIRTSGPGKVEELKRMWPKAESSMPRTSALALVGLNYNTGNSLSIVMQCTLCTLLEWF